MYIARHSTLQCMHTNGPVYTPCLLWLHYSCREHTMGVGTHYGYHDYTMNVMSTLWVSWAHYRCHGHTMDVMTTLWVSWAHYGCREHTMGVINTLITFTLRGCKTVLSTPSMLAMLKHFCVNHLIYDCLYICQPFATLSLTFLASGSFRNVINTSLHIIDHAYMLIQHCGCTDKYFSGSKDEGRVCGLNFKFNKTFQCAQILRWSTGKAIFEMCFLHMHRSCQSKGQR